MSVRNLVEASPRSLQRFVLNTSAGVERSGSLPFSILNLFGTAPATPPPWAVLR